MVEGIARMCVKWKIGRSFILGDVEVKGRNKLMISIVFEVWMSEGMAMSLTERKVRWVII